MNGDFSISEDTQAILLLCGSLGAGNAEAQPLTLPQYNAFGMALHKLGKRPADVLHDEKLIAEACAMPPEVRQVKPIAADRVRRLLSRGFALSMALERWSSCGVKLVGRGDALYPKRLRDYLGNREAPAILYYVGSERLFAGGGMAFVGSRDIAEDAVEAIRGVVRQCVDSGLPVVSGGARGADQASMREAFDCGGEVIGALPNDLMRACLDPVNREALASGKALLFSAFDPERKPDRYEFVNTAMGRNKYIYAMADSAFVAQSGVGSRSGTWSGAVEELKREEHHPVFVYLSEKSPEGNRDLIKKGGIPWKPGAQLAKMLKSAAKQVKVKTSQGSLFEYSVSVPTMDGAEPLMFAGESKAKYEAAEARTIAVAGIDLICAALKNKKRKDAELRKAVDPDKDISTKGWKRWLEQAVADGRVMKVEKPKKRGGKPDVFYALP